MSVATAAQCYFAMLVGFPAFIAGFLFCHALNRIGR